MKNRSYLSVILMLGSAFTALTLLLAVDHVPSATVFAQEDCGMPACYFNYLPAVDHSAAAPLTPAAARSSGLQTPLDSPTPGPTPTSGAILYGRHYPNGSAAVEYIFGSEGMWKEIDPAEYRWNYYCECATCTHPYDKELLIRTATITATEEGMWGRFFTAPDANCHLLLDWNHDGEIDTTAGGYAFHEHSGKGIKGETRGQPFTNFWFDDNLLARFMTEAYGYAPPNGLSDYDDFTRWQILGLDSTNWTRYPEDNAKDPPNDYIDQLALNGLYYLSINDIDAALARWQDILVLLGCDAGDVPACTKIYNLETDQFDYVSSPPEDSEKLEPYKLGLFAILTSFLLDTLPAQVDSPAAPDTITQSDLLQHWVSVRSNILSYQECDPCGGSDANLRLLGWRSDVMTDSSLINTESIAANVLGLGAGAAHVYEAGKAPLLMQDNGYIAQTHNVLSAVQGESEPGYMTYGPYQTFPIGHYEVDYFLRSPAPAARSITTATLANLDVFDARNEDMLASTLVDAPDPTVGSNWIRVTLSITVAKPENELEFRTDWYGTADMDISAIRVRERQPTTSAMPRQDMPEE